MAFLSRFLERRNWRRQARAYLRVLQREPAEADVRWLAEMDPRQDLDHARWELRYARLAIGQLEAERGSLDDRAPAIIAREMVRSLALDHRVGAGMVDVAERQFNIRLRYYRDATQRDESSEPASRRLGRELLRFVRKDRVVETEIADRAGEILRRYASEFNLALQDAYGRAVLPETVRPSELSNA